MTYYVCSDKIDKKEQSYINAVISALKSKGKNAVDGGIGPNKEALRNSKGSGDTIVFIVGGGAAGCTLASFVKEQRELNNDEIPEWISEVVSSFEKVSVGIRKG